MLASTMEFKDLFFDSPEVIKRLDAAERRILSRQGAFVRRRARTDILRRTKKRGQKTRARGANGRFIKSRETSARPGQPPIVRSRDRTDSLRNILFAYSPSSRSVFVGPVKLNGKSAGSMTIPELMEKGGAAEVRQWAPPNSNVWNLGYANEWIPGTKRRTVRGRYAPHPFMGPAIEKEEAEGNIIAPWANVL